MYSIILWFEFLLVINWSLGICFVNIFKCCIISNVSTTAMIYFSHVEILHEYILILFLRIETFRWVHIRFLVLRIGFLNIRIFFSFETSNGISQQEQGTLVNAGTENESIQVRGQYSYVGADGRTYTVIYIADENGFQPQGDHIPK